MAEIKSRWQIIYDLERAKAQAARLEDAAAGIRREAGKITDCRAGLNGAWESDNAARFTGKMGAVTEGLIKTAAQLERTADALRRNARNIYDAEMEAKRLADIRSHS